LKTLVAGRLKSNLEKTEKKGKAIKKKTAMVSEEKISRAAWAVWARSTRIRILVWEVLFSKPCTILIHSDLSSHLMTS
jgi:hypothetical protein